MLDIELEQQQSSVSQQPLRLLLALRRYAAALLLFVGVLAVFQWVVPAIGVPSFVLPPPSRVLQRMLDPQSALLWHTGVTALEGVGGFLLGGLLGFGLAVLFVHARPIEVALYPWVVVSQTVPLVAIAPLLVLWFGNGLLSRIIIAALFAFFPVLVNALRGLRLSDQATRDLLAAYGATPWQLFWTLRLPNCLPYLFTGLKIASTLAIIGALVGEFAGAGQGLGFVITVSSYHLATDQSFAAVTAAAVLGIGLYLLLVLLERWLVFWQEPL